MHYQLINTNIYGTNENGTHTEAEIGVIVSRTKNSSKRNSKKNIYALLQYPLLLALLLAFTMLFCSSEKKAKQPFKGEQHFRQDFFCIGLKRNEAVLSWL
jgi:hypothetical protein